MTTAVATSPRPTTARFLLPVLIALFVCAALWIAALLRPSRLPGATLAEVLFPMLALTATLLALARTLPAQNIFAATATIVFIASIAEIISAKTGVPFGARTYTDALGPRIFGLLPWPMPFIWTVAVLNSRGVARLILRPWRKTTKYGLWVIALACMLNVIFDFNLEPFASANSWWIWRMPKSVPAWHNAPWVTFLAWAVITLLILAFATPWLINKQRPRSSPPEYHPLVLWLLINLLPAVGDATQQLWLPAALAAALAIAATTFALRGAKW
jgi:bisanhydrobacterioruberin hydratase